MVRAMATGPPLGSRLLGRRSECDALERLVAGVRAGQSQCLVLPGDAGVGKTALLEHLPSGASDAGSPGRRASSPRWSSRSPDCMRCARLCSTGSGELPGPQRDALSTAFGLSAGPPRIASWSAWPS